MLWVALLVPAAVVVGLPAGWAPLVVGAAAGVLLSLVDLALRWVLWLRPSARDVAVLGISGGWRVTVFQVLFGAALMTTGVAALVVADAVASDPVSGDALLGAGLAALPAWRALTVLFLVKLVAPTIVRRREQMPTSAAGIAALRRDRPGDLDLLWTEAHLHVNEGHPEHAFPLYREILDHPKARPEVRGYVAASLGWGLCGTYPDDFVPDEAQQMADLTWELGSEDLVAQMLVALVAAERGEGRRAEELASKALRHCDDALSQAQVHCVLAVSFALQGRHTEARQARQDAVALAPECDVLPWADSRLAPA